MPGMIPGRGIGRAIAETLVAEGVRLALAARSREMLDIFRVRYTG